MKLQVIMLVMTFVFSLIGGVLYQRIIIKAILY